jgi:hypothetical protein
MITQAEVKELFDYSDDGELVWRANRANVKAGDIAGYRRKDGYKMLCINYKKWLLHRLVYLWHKGTLPDYLDHIDGNPWNNRIENLRECNLSQNQQNRRIGRDNTSGIKGVSWHKFTKKWRATIRYNKEQIHLGVFDSIKEASDVITQFRMKAHGEFCKLS